MGITVTSQGQDTTTTTQTKPSTMTTEGVTSTTEISTSTPSASSTPPASSESSTPSTTLTSMSTLPPPTTLKEPQEPLKPVTLSSPDFAAEDQLLNELKKKRYSVFDRDLLSVLSKESPRENIVVSPLSIKLLLALIMEGSGGQTNHEILRTLQLPLNKIAASTLLQKLQSLILPPEKSTIIVLESQNKVYKAPDVELIDDYENTISERYKTDVEEIDFTHPHTAADHINGWVNNSTHGFIPSLVEEDNIQNDMKLFLVNYIYLKGNWDSEFNRQSTRNGCFHSNFDNPQECRTVAYMNKKRAVKYGDLDDLGAQIVEIPFKDTRYVVNFVLPKEKSNAHIVLEKLSRKDLYDLFNNLEQTSVNLQLPKTTIDFSSDMGQILQHPQLRIKELFKPTADLSRMIKSKVPVGISNMVHKARIEFNEDGTKAAGVSGGGVQVLSLTNEKNVAFDRPFLFFVRDTKVGGFLFEGIIASPDEVQLQEEHIHAF